MSPEQSWKAGLLALSFAVVITGCTSEDGGADPADAGATAADQGVTSPDAGSGAALRTSAKARVRFKRAERYRNDLAQALALNPSEVCLELGQYDCVDFVHTVTIGGVEPYARGINEPLPETTATTSLAIERIALSACGRRVDADLAQPAEGVIFANLPVEGGKISDLDGAAVTAALTRLYQRSLLREPTSEELAQLRGLYASLAQDGTPNPARDWAVLTCFAVSTSLEALFY